MRCWGGWRYAQKQVLCSAQDDGVWVGSWETSNTKCKSKRRSLRCGAKCAPPVEMTHLWGDRQEADSSASLRNDKKNSSE
jgi:hypothetical protein